MQLTPKDFFEICPTPIISSETNFWLVRTNNGAFYREFINDHFIALAWNPIGITELEITNKDMKQELLEGMALEYKNISSCRGAWQKSLHFAKDMKVGDIVVIPSNKKDRLAFAVIGDYYEDHSFTTVDELEKLKSIKIGWNEADSPKCPYVKRRKIRLIAEVEGSQIHPELSKALISYHGISQINNYAKPILSSVYDTYFYQNQLVYAFNVETREKINALAYTTFTNSIATITSEMVGEENVSTTSNVNSPGFVEFIIEIAPTIEVCATQVIEFIRGNWTWMLFIHFITFGGEGWGFKFKGVLDYLIALWKSPTTKKLTDIEIEQKEEDLKQSKLKTTMMQIELDKLKSSSTKLKVEERKNPNVINEPANESEDAPSENPEE